MACAGGPQMLNLQPYHLYLCSTLSSHLSESAIFASSSQHPQAWQAQNRWRYGRAYVFYLLQFCLIPVSCLCSLFSNNMSRGSQSYTINTIGMPRRKKKLTLAKRKSRATPEEGEIWEVRAILDERTNKRGIVEYLVDWVPDKTGKEYDPEWVRTYPEQPLPASANTNSIVCLRGQKTTWVTKR